MNGMRIGRCTEGGIMKHKNYKMAGMSGLGFLLLLVVIGFFALLVIRLFPVYLEHYNVSSSLKSLQSEAQLEAMSNAEIRTSLLRRFEVNDVTHVGKEDIKIEIEDGARRVSIAYEVRKPFFGNIDLVVSFSDTAELNAP